jgi:predicted TIM-barrel fold metal-dependent hydrolase
VAVLSQATPGVECTDPAVGTELARVTNDALAEAISRHPDRFQGFAALAPNDVDGAVKELERAVKELGFKGWHTLSNFGDSFLDEKRYWPILAKVEELDVPIYLHPVIPAIPQFRTYGWGLAGAAFGFGAETAMVMMRLVISGAFDAFPKLKIILGHYGEGFPFMMDRVDRPFIQGHVRTDPKIAPKLRLMPSDYFKNNMLVSTSGNYSNDAFLCTRNALGTTRMVVGTDYPFEDMTACMGFLAAQPLSVEERMQLEFKTAAGLGF